MKLGDRGEAVVTVQSQLERLGYDVGPAGIDGILGDDTLSALREFAADRGLEWPLEVPEEVREALTSTAPAPDPEPWEPPADYKPDVRVIDVRDRLAEPQSKARVRGGRTVMRPPQQVTGITLHQAAVEYHVGPAMIRLADGDLELAQALRVQRAACHFMALQEGLVVWTRPLRSYVFHANALNRSTLGIEVEGNYAGLAGRPSTAWKGSAFSGPVSDATVQAARKALLTAVVEGRRLGMPIEHLYAHRQSSAMRRADPGEELWTRVALEYGVAELGLTVHPKAVFDSARDGQGRPIPPEWDPKSGVGRY